MTSNTEVKIRCLALNLIYFLVTCKESQICPVTDTITVDRPTV